MWPEPIPISECTVAEGEYVLCYLYYPQKNDGAWFICFRNKYGVWFTDAGEQCVPRFFVPLPPKIEGLRPLQPAHTLN